MTAPVPDIRINFDGLGLNRIANDGFETDTSGWSVSAGIQGAGTSITRNTSAGFWEGLARGRLVTTSTSGSGVKYVMSSTFTDAATYRFSVYLKSVSGATTCGIRIGSLAGAGDRATSTFTVTTTWTRYTVDLTPASPRSDIQVNVYTTSAASMTVDIDAAEVYLAADDVTARCDELDFDVGANFEGGLLSGNCTVRLRNDDQLYTGGFGTVPSLLKHNLAMYVRATYAGVPYGLFYGRIKRQPVDSVAKTISPAAADPVDAWSRLAEVNIATSTTRSIAEFRGLILDAMGEPAARRDLSAFEFEADIPVTGADRADALTLLADLDASTGSVGYLVFNPSTSVLFVYTTQGRNEAGTQAIAETLGEGGLGGVTGWEWDLDETGSVTDQRVTYMTRALQPSATLWTSAETPFTVAASSTRTVWADFSNPVQSLSVSSTATNAPTVTLTAYFQSAKITITTGGSASDVSALSITGRELTADTQSQTYSSAVTPAVVAPEITGNYVVSDAQASALAQWKVNNASGFPDLLDGRPHVSLTLEQTFPTQVMRHLAELVDGDLDALTGFSASAGLIKAINTHVDMAASHWTTTYQLKWWEQVFTDNVFTLDDALGGKLNSGGPLAI